MWFKTWFPKEDITVMMSHLYTKVDSNNMVLRTVIAMMEVFWLAAVSTSL